MLNFDVFNLYIPFCETNQREPCRIVSNDKYKKTPNIEVHFVLEKMIEHNLFANFQSQKFNFLQNKFFISNLQSKCESTDSLK